MRLYDYFRSSAAYRVRIALALKGLAPERVFVHLRKGEQRAETFLALNPQGFVPALVSDDGAILTQSLAIIEYLDEVHPAPSLLPGDAANRARLRGLAQIIACDIHPLNNLRVLKYLKNDLTQEQAALDHWIGHWIAEGFAALEAALGPVAGPFCHGNSPTLPDIVLAPQVYSARRFTVDLRPYPTLTRIAAALDSHPAFISAHPAHQPDSEPGA